MCGEDISGGTINGFVCKTDSQGNQQWRKIFSGPYTIDLLGISLTPNGGYVIYGDIFGPPVMIRNSYIIGINDIGTILWQKKYSFGIDSYFSTFSSAGYGLIFGGTVQTTQNSDSTRVFIVKTNFNGDSIKSVIFRANDFCYFPNIITIEMNKILFTYNNDTLQGTALDRTKLFILDTNLQIKKQNILDHQRNSLILSYVTQINSLAQGNIIGTGWTDFNYLGALDLYAIRFDTSLSLPNPLGVRQISNYVPKICTLLQNYPNPFNPSTKFNFTVPKTTSVSIKIYDIVGREVYTLVNQKLNAGTYVVDWNSINNLGDYVSSGVYFYKLTAGDYVETKKMILVR